MIIQINLDELNFRQLKKLFNFLEISKNDNIDTVDEYIQEKHGTLPKYVKCGDTTLRLETEEDDQYYYRLAGAWSCKYKFVDGELYSDEPEFIIPDRKLIPITYQEWYDTNLGYC